MALISSRSLLWNTRMCLGLKCLKFAWVAWRNCEGNPLVDEAGQSLNWATINLGTLPGCRWKLADTMKHVRVDITCIKKMKWKGVKAKEIGDGYTLFYSVQTGSSNGIALVISKKPRDDVVEGTRTSGRLVPVKIKSGSMTIQIISAYASQVGCQEKEKDSFGDSLLRWLWGAYYTDWWRFEFSCGHGVRWLCPGAWWPWIQRLEWKRPPHPRPRGGAWPGHSQYL